MAQPYQTREMIVESYKYQGVVLVEKMLSKTPA